MLIYKEFIYDINTEEWTQVSSLKVARTEHAMSLVYGIPTIIGESQNLAKHCSDVFIYQRWS